MRSRWIRGILCALLLFALPGTFFGFAFCLPPMYDETYLAALQEKTELLQSIEGPRVILVGGSGAAFALRSDLLEQELGLPVINDGLYAGLGTTVMLDLVKPHLHEGDIVVFLPEQSAQTLSTYFNAEAFWQACDGGTHPIGSLNAQQRGALIGAFLPFAAAKAKLFFAGEKPHGETVYARAAFNAYGDMAAAGRERNAMPLGYDPNQPISFDPALPTDAFFASVNDFSTACDRAGATLLFGFCPMNAAALDEHEAARIPAYCAALETKLDCPLLGSPEASVMDAAWFYDTNFHLNEAGQIAYTARLASQLKEYLHLDAPVLIDIPFASIGPEAELFAEASDDLFHYARTADGWLVFGLTDAAKAQTVLTVPDAYESLPVQGLGEHALAGATVLETLRLGANIALLPDGVFGDCPHLKRIELNNPSPGTCPVGRGLLEGTDALVTVPKEAFSAYATNYFWSVHVDRLIADGTVQTTASEAHKTPQPSEPQGSLRDAILFDANGGVRKDGKGTTLRQAMSRTHRRENTLRGANYFVRDGCVLIGWNTKADGSGTRIGLGSRIADAAGTTLYAMWAKANPETDFVYTEQDGTATVQKYSGEADCVVPETLGGVPVQAIAAGAFSNRALQTLVLPSGLTTIEDGAFADCTIMELTMFDTVTTVSEESFAGTTLHTLRINAFRMPVYSGSYFDTFSDKYDYLLSLKGQQKLVLFSGSSGRYGYDSQKIEAAFPAYRVVNMGVYAYTTALPQYDLILQELGPGDVLLSAPEFDAVREQFCKTNALDSGFWAMMESNYDAAARLDFETYSDVFSSFAAYQSARGKMVGKNYGESPSSYDDDGNRYAFATYNVYGDFILPRPNSPKDERLRHNIADYTLDSIPTETVEALNRVYQKFLDRGVTVYFSYTPRNRSSLTERSTPEAIAALHRHLCETLCVPVISNIEDSLFSGVYFWLIDSHLSTEGVMLRTERIIRDLEAVLR